jgi:site-specific DNA-methyltransferase (adenine-specific)/modification methylase
MNWRVIQGDCLTEMAKMEAGSFDAVITDPPYGIDYKPQRSLSKCHKWQSQKPFTPVAGDSRPFDPSPLLSLGLPTILWGANHYADKLPPSGGWLVWDKRGGGTISQGFIASDVELAWTNIMGTAKIFTHMWCGLCRDTEVGKHYHPTQKPVALMRWCLSIIPNAKRILDPFCGSGTTGVACAELGRDFVGIEISEEYCAIARRRIDAATRQGRLGL